MKKVAISLVLVACGSEPERIPASATVKPHVVLISLDTTRADRLGSYGYEKAQTETLDALANKGIRYERAYSPAPLTIPAHISLFTGLYPPRHGVRGNGDGVLEETDLTLTKELAANGYKTGASVAAFVTTRKWGFNHGFNAFYDSVPVEKNAWRGERPAGLVVDDALGWVKENGFQDPLFLWVHLYDAHYPLQAPAEYGMRIPNRPYDAEIAYVDDQVQRIVEAFGDEPTLFVVVGDHGEGLGEHGETGHGYFVYDSTQRVPMFMSGPGIEPGVEHSPVSLVDVMPTVLDALGYPSPASIDGRVAPHGEPVYMEAFMLQDRLGLAPHIGLVKGQDKLIDVPRPELYNLPSDPGELKDLASADMARVVSLKQALDGFSFAPRDASAAMNLDPEVAMQLEALGYVQPTEQVEAGTVLDDPKDHTDLILWTQQSERLVQRGEFKKADVILKKLTEQYPHLTKAKVSRITALGKLGRMKEAIKLARETHQAHPDDANVTAMLAGLLGQSGQWDEAAKLYREAAEALPWASHLRVRGVMSSSQVKGNEAESLALAERYLKEEPDNEMLAGFVGLQYLRSERVIEGMKLLKLAAKAEQPLPMVCFHLGAHAHQEGLMNEAEGYLLREVEFHPNNVMAFRLLKDVYVEKKNWKGMVRLAQRALENEPTAEWSRVKALGLFNLKDYALCRGTLNNALKKFPQDANLVLLDSNLLNKEGKNDEAMTRFEEAKRLRAQKKDR